jgi:hypothetical protein
MNTNGRDIPWIDKHFYTNQQKVRAEALLPYLGKHVAWSLDGTRIVASGDTPEEVKRNLLAAGEDPSRVVWEYVEAEGASL